MCVLCVRSLSYRQTSNIKRTNSKVQMLFVQSCNCLCQTHISQVLSRQWRCSSSRTDRRCTDYIWLINTYITNYIRDLMILHFLNTTPRSLFHIQYDPRTVSSRLDSLRTGIHQLTQAVFYIHLSKLQILVCACLKLHILFLIWRGGSISILVLKVFLRVLGDKTVSDDKRILGWASQWIREWSNLKLFFSWFSRI